MKLRKKQKRSKNHVENLNNSRIKSLLKTLKTCKILENPGHLTKTLSGSGKVTAKHSKICSAAKRLAVHGTCVEIGTDDSKKKILFKEQLNTRLLSDKSYLERLGFKLST